MMKASFLMVLFATLLSCGQKPVSYQEAKALLEKEKYKEAVHILDKIIDQNHNFDSAYIDRAFAYGRLGDFENALEDYTHLSGNPSFKTQAFMGRGDVYFAMNEYAKSIDEYTLAIRNTPDNSEAYFYRGISYTFLKIPGQNPNGPTYHDPEKVVDFYHEFPKALADFSKAIELDSLCTNCYIQRAEVYEDMQNLESALTDFNKAIAVDPENPQTYFSRGIYYRHIDRNDLALVDLNKAIQLDPNDPYPYANRAYLYGETGNNAAACNDMKKAEQLGYELREEDNKYCR